MQHVYFTPATRILRGLDEIARYLRISRRTAQRWATDCGLPAMRSPAGVYMSSTSLVDLWILACGDTIPKKTLNKVAVPTDG